MKLLLTLIVIFIHIPAHAATLLLDWESNVETTIVSNIAYQEQPAKTWEFETTVPDQQIRIDFTMPFTIHQTMNIQPQNGAFRLYLDGTEWKYFQTGAKQWNGKLVFNGGGFSWQPYLPYYSRVSGSWTTNIQNPGSHYLHLMYSGSSPNAIGTMKVWRRLQITDLSNQ